MATDPLDETQAESSPPGTVAAGATIGGYQLGHVLGEGGMGVVWSAHDPNLDRTIAIKVLRRGDAAPELRTRLLREARAMAKLKHPNVLTVYEVGTEGERDFIAMELVDGGSLDRWLESKPARDEIAAVLIAAGRGLAAAHAAGLVHRDFKPHNVLRSRDGTRIVVTDFGLARGIADGQAPSALDKTIDPANDDILSSPLTQTGALLGTPAYMAPEQFAGKPSDARTDQFAFCVTAWQALTGERPFVGTTIDELRRAVQAGVDNRDVDLPGGVRQILARGLEPDPERRWPDLDALLAAFAQAMRMRARRWPMFAIGAGVVAAGAIAVVAMRGSAKPEAAVCGPGDVPMWSAQVPSVVVGGATALERERARWLVDHEAACKASTPERLACLDAERDRIAAYVAVLATLDPTTLPTVNPFDDLVTVVGCTPLPAQREEVTRLWRAVLVARAAASEHRQQAIEDVDAAAHTSWPPGEAFGAAAVASIELAAGEATDARARLERALTFAKEPRLAARIRLGLLEASLVELVEPRDQPGGTTGLKAPVLHVELQRLLDAGHRAVEAAGNPPQLVGELAADESLAQRGLSQWSFYSRPGRQAIQLAQLARTTFEQIGDITRATDAAVAEARAELAMGEVDDAIAAVHASNAALDRVHVPAPSSLIDTARELARMRGLPYQGPEPPSLPAPGPIRAGRVVGPDGKPQRALVVAWQGDLQGDSVRPYRDAAAVPGEAIKTDPEGRFEIHAELGAAIIAETGDMRTAPQLVSDAPLTLRLEPTQVLAGSVEEFNVLGVEAFARFTVGANAWYIFGPITHERTFELRHLPAGPFTVGTTGPAGDGKRRVLTFGSHVTKPAWSSGPNLEVIARGVTAGATVYVLRGKFAPADRAALQKLVTDAADVASARLHPVGFDATYPGRSLYTHGDRHAVITGCAVGDITACVESGDRVRCSTTTLGPPKTRDYSTGLVAFQVVPLVIE